jgi:3-phenylpropionate/trans-cinnamate dioxygenase ferredoxin subunit
MSQHTLCRFDDFPDGTARRFEVDGRSVAVVRIGDDVYAIGDTCSHANFSLSEGEVLCETKELECWKHGSAFSLETGEAMTLPATQPVPVYEVSVIAGDVVIDVSSTRSVAS